MCTLFIERANRNVCPRCALQCRQRIAQHRSAGGDFKTNARTNTSNLSAGPLRNRVCEKWPAYRQDRFDAKFESNARMLLEQSRRNFDVPMAKSHNALVFPRILRIALLLTIKVLRLRWQLLCWRRRQLLWRLLLTIKVLRRRWQLLWRLRCWQLLWRLRW